MRFKVQTLVVSAIVLLAIALVGVVVTIAFHGFKTTGVLITAWTAIVGVVIAQAVSAMLAANRTQVEALQQYLKEMGELLSEHPKIRELESDHHRDLRMLARAHTLTVLNGLSPARKRVVLEYLRETQLISAQPNTLEGVSTRPQVIPLGGADLAYTDLKNARFAGTYLAGAVLQNADFTGADLAGTILREADLSGAKLQGTDLSGADLSNAKSLTQEQVEQAIGDIRTKIPESLKLPDAWSTPREAPNGRELKAHHAPRKREREAEQRRRRHEPEMEERESQDITRGVTHDDPQISIKSFGPGPEFIDEISQAALNHPSVQEQLSETRYRLLSVRLLEPALEGKPDGPLPPDRYEATIYDYTNNRVVLATGRLDDVQGSTEVSEAGHQPLPNREEFDEAVEILLDDEDLGPAIREQRLVPYRPMPPLVEAELPDGRVERTLAVGLLSPGDEARHEIVGANMIHRSVMRFRNGAPERALAAAAVCGLPRANQPTAARGTPGQFRVTVDRGGTRLWSFLVIRPSASSGTNASGVELRHVMYRGKLVLFQAHAPILNVRYDGNACGPFRDWLFEESWIQADGTDVAPGIRRCQAPAETILESGTDSGNFRGVAIYREGQEVVVVSELQAGWYRYVSQWRFHEDGTIRPRFGFSAVRNACVCNVHHHHVYWRFDFDIGTAENNAVREFNSPPLFPPDNWHTHRFEATRRRNSERGRRWQTETRRPVTHTTSSPVRTTA